MTVRGATALGALLAVVQFTTLAVADDSISPTAAADYSAVKLLAAAQTSLASLNQEQDELARDISYRTAVTSLTGLYRLHGCQWAYPTLLEVAGQPDCPEMYYDISADGRLAVTVDRLELRNEVFQGYAIYLCTLESMTAEVLSRGKAGKPALEFELAGGGILPAESLTPEHPLWQQLSRLKSTFLPPESLYPGSAFSFKQVFLLPEGHMKGAQAAVLRWGDYGLRMPVYSKESHD